MKNKQHQPPLTVEEQINNLKSIGLIISDEEEAKCFLNDLSHLGRAYLAAENSAVRF